MEFNKDTFDDTVAILLVRGESPTDAPIWAYCAVKAGKVAEFMTAQREIPFYPAEFGIVLEAGEGKEPGDAVRERMAVEYGFDHGAMFDLIEPPSNVIAFFDLKPVQQQPIGAVSKAISEKLVLYFKKHPDDLQKLQPRRFEELVAELFDGFGYEVELTKRTHDGGVDVIAVKNAEVKVKYLIECKQPSERGYVSVSPVRELLGVKSSERATKAIIATTAKFSRAAQEFYVKNRWELELRDYHGLLEWIDEYLDAKGLS